MFHVGHMVLLQDLGVALKFWESQSWKMDVRSERDNLPLGVDALASAASHMAISGLLL